MSYTPRHSSTSKRRQQEIRVQEFRDRLQIPIEGTISSYSQRDLDATEGFLRYLITLEGRPTTTLAKQLIRIGVALPAPDQLDHQALSAKLNEIIEGLARLRNFLVAFAAQKVSL